ncbi:helix-hairpin-helix domain-containing protein [Peribacillus sp. NPDC097675]|uniref:helix-hairpin-helix domain-containing protein n=1 Tax=Peribacillus sp. NPDC097675 TaxID=3390618 RepID=UPI003CFEA4A3
MDTILKKKISLIAVAVVIVAIGFYLFYQPEKKPGETEDIFAISTSEETTDEVKPKTEAGPQIMKVDVKGAVQAPGVFTAQAGDRVIDLISEAGSFTDKADKDKVNLAQLVEDQMVIYVPKKGEEGAEIPGGMPATLSNGSTGTDGAAGSSGGQVNLNTATQADLETLSGIGPSKATAILEYRDSIGKFKQVEDLKNVSGIGDKTFEKLKESISVQ